MGRPMTHRRLTVGETCGGWTVIALTEKNWSYLCRCKCGLEKRVYGKMFLKGSACNSCMDTVRAVTASQTLTRNKTRAIRELVADVAVRQRLRRIIGAVFARCYREDNANYRWYGARGIRVHPAWCENRVAFFAYLITLPGYDDLTLTLDRVDNDGNYEPGNLRFATMREQRRNQGSSV